MSLKVVFFASIREALGTPETMLELEPDTTLSQLVARLRETYGDAADVLVAENTRVAVNQELVTGDPRLDGATEVAFFPPVTGG